MPELAPLTSSALGCRFLFIEVEFPQCAISYFEVNNSATPSAESPASSSKTAASPPNKPWTHHVVNPHFLSPLPWATNPPPASAHHATRTTQHGPCRPGPLTFSTSSWSTPAAAGVRPSVRPSLTWLSNAPAYEHTAVHPSVCRRTFGLLPSFGCCAQCC